MITSVQGRFVGEAVDAWHEQGGWYRFSVTAVKPRRLRPAVVGTHDGHGREKELLHIDENRLRARVSGA